MTNAEFEQLLSAIRNKIQYSSTPERISAYLKEVEDCYNHFNRLVAQSIIPGFHMELDPDKEGKILIWVDPINQSQLGPLVDELAHKSPQILQSAAKDVAYVKNRPQSYLTRVGYRQGILCGSCTSH